MVYTSAADVATLNANPLVQVGAIYQDARNWPVIVNVIDTSPRPLRLAPPQFASRIETATRLDVVTKANTRSPTRVGLVFERVEVRLQSLLGTPLAQTLPSLGFDLPRFPSSLLGGDDAGPNYFEVRYLDDDFLVIQQASPGGLFASIAVESPS